ncbi:Phosphoribosylformylglycinamidine synthase, partial [Daphnia magna]
GHRLQLRRPGLRVRPARQPRDGASLPGSDRPLLAAGCREPHQVHPRRGCRWHLQRPAGTDQRRWSRRPFRTARRAQRRAGHEPAGNLVQRVPGTLRDVGGRRRLRAFQGHLRTRALPLRGGRRGH